MAVSIDSLLPYQPFKAIYVLTVLLYTLARFPLWLLSLLPRSLRQHSSWSLRQAFMVRLVKTFTYHSSRVRSFPAWSLQPGSEKEKFERILPSTKDIYRGVLDDKEIKPVEIGGTWFPAVYGPGDPKRKGVILHFHGGAFVEGDGRMQTFGYAAHLLTSHTAAWVLSVQYRTSSNPGCRFPAALQDAVTAYQSLLDRGIPASSIVVSGDSAGGNMAAGFLRYIEDNPGILPKPRAALLWCPWVYPAIAMQPYSCSGNPRYETDFLNDVFAEWGIKTYASPPVDPTNPYVSPRDHPFKCEGVPMWIQFGSLEILAADIVKFADGMRSIEGNEVELHEDEDTPHDIFLVGGLLGFQDKAEKMAAAMGAWLKPKLQ
ncbi:MAG: hypothetical protein LQ346_006978 [Caloplaca aetnensis]|nr:MAG: hypothetical protein LQ346_006978 [Caloplaca aetnensis]